MKRQRQLLVVLAALAAVGLYGPVAHADMFGGLEAAYTRDDNFNGAPQGSDKVAETIMTYSGYLGYYWPSADQRSAFVLKGDAAIARLDRFDVFDNTSAGLGAGFYHGFSRANSMTGMASAHAKRFDDSSRDYDVYAATLGFKQKTGDTFWFREGLLYETASAKVRSNEYDGYGVNLSLNWNPQRATLLTLGAGRTVRDYDVTVANRRTSDQATLGLVQEFGPSFYLRAGVTWAKNKTNAGAEYNNNVYTVALGVAL